ncbi:MAG: Uma2 family endonuclease [Gammaproteobacteria bacterium]|nr:Uma2 family endonuclease [Gammaproteobacteria bacterium]MBA3731122.1 Uma2 family endonuclease [Gammaproteobacteria bacterium]
MLELLRSPWTLEDFLTWENSQQERYEFVDGIVRMMVGGTIAHNTITLNLASALRSGLRGSNCRVFMSDVKLVSSQTGEAAYPDVVVTCQLINPKDNRVTEPTLIAEVLSRSTADYDRGAKFEMYKAIPSVRYCLLIAQDRRQVDLYRRTATGWDLTRLEQADKIELSEFGWTLDLNTVYEDCL